MSECRAVYQGDEALAGLLAKHGGADLAAVKALLAGLASASVDQSDTDWPRLIAADPSPALVAQLEALKAELKAAQPQPMPLAERVPALRALLAQTGIDGFLIPRADEHQGDSLAPHAERLPWLTGFTGSAGIAVVLTERAALFVDGRYTEQARNQTDVSVFEQCHLINQPPSVWLQEAAKPGQRIAFDPWLHSLDMIEKLAEALADSGVTLVPVEPNPVDMVWGAAQPPVPLGPVRLHPDARAGRSSADKRAALATDLQKQKVAASVMTTPESIAWLLNIRGADVPNKPVAQSFALARADGTLDWFIDARKLLPGVTAHLGNSVRVRDPLEFVEALRGFSGQRVLLNAAACAWGIAETLTKTGATVVRGADPVAIPRACKTEAELQGARDAHLRDGAAVIRFLAWVSREALSGRLTEIAAADQLEAFRRDTGVLRGLSFNSISAAGPNAALPHYRPTPEAQRVLTPGEIYLIDSGGQYEDGTTDITRTLAIGTPTPAMRRHFTLVLKGHIAIATLRFPTGTTGGHIDAMARQFLWADGLDYDHGTGHGVGSFLSVHEGPQSISKAGTAAALMPGMILSNEPGYYKPGAYGIRCENLVIVRTLDLPGAEREIMGFETLTFAPWDRSLIDLDILTPAERAWIDAYHAEVRVKMLPQLDGEAAAWLEAATAAL